MNQQVGKKNASCATASHTHTSASSVHPFLETVWCPLPVGFHLNTGSSTQMMTNHKSGKDCNNNIGTSLNIVSQENLMFCLAGSCQGFSNKYYYADLVRHCHSNFQIVTVCMTDTCNFNQWLNNCLQ